MKSYSSREVIKILEADGWHLVSTRGSHHQFKHPDKKGRVTVKHPDKNIPLDTIKSIERQSGIKFVVIIDEWDAVFRECKEDIEGQKQYLDFLKDNDVQSIIESGDSPKDILKQLHFIVAGYLIKNPKFTKAITGFVLFKRDLSKESFSFQYVYRHYAGKKSKEECSLIAYELSTMMQLIIFRAEDFKRDFGIDLTNEEELKHYIDMRVDLLLA